MFPVLSQDVTVQVAAYQLIESIAVYRQSGVESGQPVWQYSGMNVYVRLTEEFNRGRVRTVISSGQAVVLHKLAIMSKDGD